MSGIATTEASDAVIVNPLSSPLRAPGSPASSVDSPVVIEQLQLDRIKLKEQLADAFSMLSQLRSSEATLTAQLSRAAAQRDAATAEKERVCSREQQLLAEVSPLVTHS